MKSRIITIFFLVLGSFPTLYGKSFLVRNISVISNTKTDASIILQEMTLKENQEYTSENFEIQLSNSAQKLKTLGIFGMVCITAGTNRSRITNADSFPMDITVTVTERWTLFPIPFYFYDNKLGHILGFLLNERNLFGLNMSLELRFRFESIPDSKELALSYTYPRLFGGWYSGKIKFQYQNYIDFVYTDSSVVYSARSEAFSFLFKLTRKLEMLPAPFSLGIQTEMNSATNIVLTNRIGRTPENALSWYFSLGAEHGAVDRDLGKAWGDNNSLWLGISPLDAGWTVKLQLSKFFAIGGKSTLGYRLNAWAQPGKNEFLDSDQIRGIKFGEVRGNYLFFGNLEYRPFILTLPWPTELDFYIPVFLDVGIGTTNGRPFNISDLNVTPGFGLRFYPRYLGGDDANLRIDIGFNISAMLKGLGFGDYFYIAFDFDEVF